MLQAFTRNYHDNSTDAGFQFTFYCDVCNDGYKSSFIESDAYKKRKGSRPPGQGIGLACTAGRGGSSLPERFDGKRPGRQSEAKRHFHRCPNCDSRGERLRRAAAPSGKRGACGFDNAPGTKFRGGCGMKLT